MSSAKYRPSSLARSFERRGRLCSCSVVQSFSAARAIIFVVSLMHAPLFFSRSSVVINVVRLGLVNMARQRRQQESAYVDSNLRTRFSFTKTPSAMHKHCTALSSPTSIHFFFFLYSHISPRVSHRHPLTPNALTTASLPHAAIIFF